MTMDFYELKCTYLQNAPKWKMEKFVNICIFLVMYHYLKIHYKKYNYINI